MKKLLGISCVLALFACTQTKFTGTIDTTDTGIVGKVTYATGKAAPDAQVKLFITRDTSRTALAQMSTDNSGSFTFDSLAPGSYNVWIESNDSLVAFIDSVYVPKNTQVRRDATLGKSGSITAIVGLQTGDDPRSVFVQALGTQKYSNVDSSGVFTIPKLAEGEYTLRLVSTAPGYTPTYKPISITSGVDDTLKDTIKLIYTGIPPVANIKAEYDPFTGIAKISWSAMAYANLYDYLIYRDIPGSITLSTVPIAASTDTVFYDTLFGNPAASMIGWPDSSIGNANMDTSSALIKYRYRVTIRNKSDQEGLPYNFADISGTNPINLMHVISPNDNAKFTNGTDLSVSWNAAASAQNYQVAISSKSDFSDTVFTASIKDTVKALPDLALGYYYAHVRAQGPNEQWGFWSKPRRFLVYGDLFANTLGRAVNFGADKLIQSKDGGYLMLGEDFNPVNNSSFLYVIKTDSMGNEVWHQSYNLPGYSIDAFQTDDNGYLIAVGTGGDIPFFLLKIDQKGTIVWSKTNSDMNAFSAGMTINSIIKAPDNGLIIDASVLLANSIYHQEHILKFDGLGLKQWDQIIDTTYESCLLQMGPDSFAAIRLLPRIENVGGGQDTVLDTAIFNFFDYLGNAKTSRKVHIPEMSISLNPGVTSACSNDLGEIFILERMVITNTSIIKVNSDWTAIGLGVAPYSATIQSMQTGGYIQATRSNPANNQYPWSIGKMDDAGNTLWSKNIPSTQIAFAVEPDGSVVVAVTLLNSINQNNGVLLYKISKDGVSFEQ